MGVPSRTSASTPAHDQTYLDIQIILGKVRPFTSPGRGPSTDSDHCSSGTVSVLSATDPLELAAAAGDNGLTAKDLAVAMFDELYPTKAEIEKARRLLDKLAGGGKLVRIPGATGGPDGGIPTKWLLP